MTFLNNYIEINGFVAPAPVTYEVQSADLDSDQTTRNENGVLKRDRIRRNVYKIIATWRLNTDDLAKLVNALAPSSFTVKFIDLTTCTYQTKTMYAGDRSATVVIGSNSVKGILVDFSCNLIEM